MEITRVIPARNSVNYAVNYTRVLPPVGGYPSVIGPEPGGEETPSLLDLLEGEPAAVPPPAPSRVVWMEPRPDLTADNADWKRLLRLAYAKSGDDPDGVFGVLHGVRCCGARLERQRGKWRILPPAEGTDDAEWEDLRQRWLTPHRETIAELLTQLGSSR